MTGIALHIGRHYFSSSSQQSFDIGIIVPLRKVNSESSHDLPKVTWLLSERPETSNTLLKSQVLK